MTYAATENKTLAAVALIGALSLVVFAKDLFIDNAVVFHDEYVYKVSADRQVDQALVLERDLAPAVPNRLFLAVYGYGSYFGGNYYAFAQFLNVVFWALGLWALYRLALLTGLSGGAALAFLGVAALLPLSSYTKYFMPEAMFFALFCCATYALLYGVFRKVDAPVIVAGLLVGLLYFVKPHALALVIAILFFLVLVPRRVRLLGLFAVGVAVAVTAGKLIAPMPADTSGMGLGIYQQVMDGLLLSLLKSGDKLKVFGIVAGGHALFPLCCLALSLLAVAAVMVPWLRSRDPAVRPAEEVRALFLYVFATTVVLVGMSVAFTALSGEELGRIHSRYYFFLYPLALLVLFHFPKLRLSTAGRVVGLALATVGPVLMVLFGQGYSAVLPISLVPDCPEWGFIFFSQPVFWGAMVAFAATGAWAVFRPQMTPLLVGVLCLTSLLSGIDVATKQKTMYRGLFVTGREAVAVEEHIGREQMVETVVVGENRDVVSKFLFGLTSTPRIEQLPAGSNLDHIPGRYPQVTHVIALSDTFVLVPPLYRCTLERPSVRICSIIR